MSHEQRRGLLCGWIPERDWLPEEQRQRNACRVPGSPVHRPEICPGYATTLPEVITAVRAWGWWDKGQLALRHPDPSERLMDLVELFNQERAAAEQYMLDQQMKESKRGSR